MNLFIAIATDNRLLRSEFSRQNVLCKGEFLKISISKIIIRKRKTFKLGKYLRNTASWFCGECESPVSAITHAQALHNRDIKGIIPQLVCVRKRYRDGQIGMGI